MGRPLLLPLTRLEGGLRVSGLEDKDPEDGIEAKLLVPVLDGGPDCRNISWSLEILLVGPSGVVHLDDTKGPIIYFIVGRSLSRHHCSPESNLVKWRPPEEPTTYFKSS